MVEENVIKWLVPFLLGSAVGVLSGVFASIKIRKRHDTLVEEALKVVLRDLIRSRWEGVEDPTFSERLEMQAVYRVYTELYGENGFVKPYYENFMGVDENE